ncbi:MAG TPA: EAL domain-containing protein [Acidocella sp.]|nr:EAL domain-containing protein [Acidocella sp.]
MTARTERELRQHNARHRIIERRRIVQKLRQALATDELALHFQPIVALGNGFIQGAEAMLRLNHSRRGLIPAGHFLPLAEQSDVIIDVGGWMLRAACEEVTRLPAHFTISLALSLRHLQSGQLVRHLLEALNGAGIAPERLELLITEAMLLDDNEDTIFALKAVQGLGVRLALNNFGTGYASLAPLKRLPFSTLRLDKSLAQNLGEDAAVTAIAHAAVEAGHALGCAVLADGVETATQYELLRQVHADKGQGAFFGAAAPGTALAGDSSSIKQRDNSSLQLET